VEEYSIPTTQDEDHICASCVVHNGIGIHLEAPMQVKRATNSSQSIQEAKEHMGALDESSCIQWKVPDILERSGTSREAGSFQ
jgi:hypothetical protein